MEVKRPDGVIEVIKYPEGKYRTIIIDTINALQNNLYNNLLQAKGKAGYDDWKDFGVEIFDLYRKLKTLPDVTLVQVLGYEGVGKTFGASYLNPEETVIFNCDQKPLSFFGGRMKYPVDNSKKNYKEYTTYDEVYTGAKAVNERRKGSMIIYILGHIVDYKSGDNQIMRQRLKVLGKQATNLGLEGLNFVHTYYARIDPNLPMTDGNRYRLVTVNSGFNTARSPQGYWKDAEIANNYQLINDRILEDYGELKPISQ